MHEFSIYCGDLRQFRLKIGKQFFTPEGRKGGSATQGQHNGSEPLSGNLNDGIGEKRALYWISALLAAISFSFIGQGSYYFKLV